MVGHVFRIKESFLKKRKKKKQIHSPKQDIVAKVENQLNTKSYKTDTIRRSEREFKRIFSQL